MSSRERFIRCKHCGLPHEAEATLCPFSGKEIIPEKKAVRASVPPAAAAGPPKPAVASSPYEWQHSLKGSGESQLDTTDPSVLVGRTVEGKYRIDALLGSGGMGAVFSAENLRIGKQVAIKILLRAYAKDSEAERRFYREARMAGSLGHPNIVEVFDMGALENGQPFQVMELLRGETLASRLKTEGALAFEDSLEIAEQVLSALIAAHQKGVVHRDLKPENIFLTERGGERAAKLLDFGISKNLQRGDDETLSLTRPGAVVGTPYYLSPEQARGDRVDHRADLWAMGVVLYEMLTGSLPYKAENYNRLIVKILTTRPAPPRSLRPAIEPALEEIVLRALSFEPDQRFQSAAEMRGALRVFRGTSTGSMESFSVEVDDDPTEVSDAFRSSVIAKALSERGPKSE
jgi:serine/threonine protein kinase